jgi:hypothetical protein
MIVNYELLTISCALCSALHQVGGRSAHFLPNARLSFFGRHLSGLTDNK